jgi:hypothetical protein
VILSNLIYGTLSCNITAQSRGAEIVTVKVWFRILRRWVIAFEDELAIFERCSSQQTSMYDPDDQVLETVGDSSDLQQREGI